MIAGVLLAAGRATRFGGPKLLQPLASGLTVAEQAAQNLLLAVPDALAVIRPGDTALRDVLAATGIAVLECPASARGMGASLAGAIRARAGATGWVIALADMPWIRAATFYAVAQQLRDGAPLVVPEYQGRRGHPVGFSAEFQQQLMELDGDIGARQLLAAQAARVLILKIKDPGVIADVDTPMDLKYFTLEPDKSRYLTEPPS